MIQPTALHQYSAVTSFQNNTGLLAGVGTSKQICFLMYDSIMYLYRPVAKAAGLCFLSAGKIKK